MLDEPRSMLVRCALIASAVESPKNYVPRCRVLHGRASRAKVRLITCIASFSFPDHMADSRHCLCGPARWRFLPDSPYLLAAGLAGHTRVLPGLTHWVLFLVTSRVCEDPGVAFWGTATLTLLDRTSNGASSPSRVRQRPPSESTHVVHMWKHHRRPKGLLMAAIVCFCSMKILQARHGSMQASQPA